MMHGQKNIKVVPKFSEVSSIPMLTSRNKYQVRFATR